MQIYMFVSETSNLHAFAGDFDRQQIAEEPRPVGRGRLAPVRSASPAPVFSSPH